MTTTNASFLEKQYFPLRRLHSLLGIIPVGVFLFPHLTANSSIIWGKYLNAPKYVPEQFAGHAGVEAFQHDVNFIHSLPALILIEWTLFACIAIHAVLGIWYALSGRINVRSYPYADNWRYTLQRLSGYIGIVFIFMHITSLRFGNAVPLFTYGGLMPAFEGPAASSTTAIHFQEGLWGLVSVAFYLICVLSLVFHFANGLWTAALTWGVTVSEAAQKRWGYVCTLIGIGLGIAAILAVIGFATLDIEQAQAIEALMVRGGH